MQHNPKKKRYKNIQSKTEEKKYFFETIDKAKNEIKQQQDSARGIQKEWRTGYLA